MGHKRERIEYCCERCTATFKSNKWLEKHVITCDGILKGRFAKQVQLKEGKENKDWVSCRICLVKELTLTKHITQVHNISKEEYVATYPNALVTCEKSASTFNGRGQNFAWLKRAKARGDDLSAYREKMSEAVRRSILSNPEERLRRSLQMATNNRTPEARKKSSETAKVTSARPEILQARTLRLQNSYKPSKPERAIEQLLIGYGFVRSVLISDQRFRTRTHRRQIDFANQLKKIFIEFDGQQHFMPAWKRMSLNEIHMNDVELDRWAIENGYAIIRIGWKKFNSRNNALSDLAKRALIDLIERSTLKGVWLIGEEYQTYSHPSTLESNVNFYSFDDEKTCNIASHDTNTCRNK